MRLAVASEVAAVMMIKSGVHEPVSVRNDLPVWSDFL